MPADLQRSSCSGAEGVAGKDSLGVNASYKLPFRSVPLRPAPYGLYQAARTHVHALTAAHRC